MTNFLFTLWDGGGASPPVLDVAAALVARGHDVRVLADPVLHDEVDASGAEHVHWTDAPHRTERRPETDLVQDWTFRTPMGAFGSIAENLIFGPCELFVRDVLAEHERRAADVIVTEMVLAGALVAAEAAGVPSAALFTTIYPLPEPGLPPFGPGFKPAAGPAGRLRDALFTRAGMRLWDRGLPALNAARAAHGLAPLDHALDQLRRADRLLVLSSEAFDFPAAALPPKVRYVGPRTNDPVWTGEAWTPPAGDDPLVLVGLSSTYQDQLDLLRRTADALGRLPVRGVLTTGPAIDPSDVGAPANVQVLRTAPHNEILDHASLVITHAGHGTTLKALSRGVPLVCAPMGRDQLEVATRVVARGAGVKVRPSASPKRIAAAAERVLSDPSYAAAAKRLAATLQAERATDHAVEELEALTVALSPATTG